ncbi:uncharacterized protein LACBIDRAFT_315375 [Laccaria bicolor S238N-H82]|uniref:Predicted protein n=1 Tax=Laccaria bicolor (strain S238N-H82 / ATCC MYA-4686) TaxID=486041 RepID=B0D289_LACBS|nr:uncharacterized protein LACBIDRAFT_315375 [Laccaria bicolor S238N-H82]EDR10702.1 predicted protein [Laccaria bicolor S238N-H82]|eukprot:XP_001878003.1 predicted protein [Laccaria bicolor S238N-H82]
MSQEFYIWPSETQAVKNGLDQPTAAPVSFPLWFNPYRIDYQFGNSLLISPVTQNEATSLGIYLPKDMFYDFKRLTALGEAYVSLKNLPITYSSFEAVE